MHNPLRGLTVYSWKTAPIIALFFYKFTDSLKKSNFTAVEIGSNCIWSKLCYLACPWHIGVRMINGVVIYIKRTLALWL